MHLPVINIQTVLLLNTYRMDIITVLLSINWVMYLIIGCPSDARVIQQRLYAFQRQRRKGNLTSSIST